ncbi:TetR/AcrR family transcriptional regulator [Paenibacillus sp. GCM10027627]|uniref:TetR/AcrR family transcriptional regulator n=1 Tax=unclassified Paenibacillus TaxID=185978 RepID=UPI0036312C82
MSKKQKQTEETKARISEAATALFSQKGFHAASIEDIAAATGVSKANIYYHFNSKEGLFLYLMDQFRLEWNEMWEVEKTKFSTVTELLYGMVETSVERGLRHPLTRAAREFVKDAQGKSPDIKEQIALRHEEGRQIYRTILEQGITAGEFKQGNVDQLSLVMECLFCGINEVVQNMELDEAKKLYRTALDSILMGIAERH